MQDGVEPLRIEPDGIYTSGQVRELFGIGESTLTRWVKAGLRVNRDTKPMIIFGDDLIEYLRQRDG